MSLIISIVAYSFLALVALIPLSETFTTYRFRKSIKVIAAIGLLVFGIWDIYNRYFENENGTNKINVSIKSGTNSVRDKVDSASQKTVDSLNGIHKDMNKGFQDVKPKPFPKPIYSAIIGLTPMRGNNPLVTKRSSDDTLDIKFLFTNFGKGVAFNVHGFGICVTQNNGKLKAQNQPPVHGGNKSIQWQANSNINYSIDTDIIQNKSDDSIFYCLKLDFTDSTGIKKSYPQILLLNKKTLQLESISDEDYNRVELFLKRHKVWKPPFRQ